MSLRLDGKELAKELEIRLQFEISSGLINCSRPPGLAVIRIGDDPASEVYVANKEKACQRVGIKSFVFHLESNCSIENIIEKIQLLNSDKNVDGILVQLPLPNGLDSTKILQTIDPDKDADGLHALNLGRLLKGESGPRSCTPAGVMALLNKNDIQIENRRAVVVGRSILVGQPMALMLQAANATVTIAHSRTLDLVGLTMQADLLVVAAGKPRMIGPEHVRNDAVVVDVGIHRVNNLVHPGRTKLCGDVKYEELLDVASAITPVPGGIGPMTVSMLLVNTVSMWQKHCDLSLTLGDLLP